MGKLLTWVVVGMLVWLVLQAIRGSQRRRQGLARGDDPPQRLADVPQAPFGGERMVRCEHCGVHLPISDALALGERRYCSAAHRDARPGV
jgi:uncharacterized protein